MHPASKLEPMARTIARKQVEVVLFALGGQSDIRPDMIRQVIQIRMPFQAVQTVRIRGPCAAQNPGENRQKDLAEAEIGNQSVNHLLWRLNILQWQCVHVSHLIGHADVARLLWFEVGTERGRYADTRKGPVISSVWLG